MNSSPSPLTGTSFQKWKRPLFTLAGVLSLSICFIFFQNFSKFEESAVYPVQMKYSELKDSLAVETHFDKNKEFYTFITAPSTASKVVVCYNISGSLEKECNQPIDGTEIDLTHLEAFSKEIKRIEIPGCLLPVEVTFHTYRIRNTPEEMALPQQSHTKRSMLKFDVSTYVAGEYECNKGFVEDGILRFSHNSYFTIQ